ETIQDAAGMSSSIDYTSEWPWHLYTPYGTTTFNYNEGPNQVAGGWYRWADITEPNGGHQIYGFTSESALLFNGTPWIPSPFPASLVPGNLPAGTMLETNTVNRLNSFHWDQHQAPNIGYNFGDFMTLTTNDMQKARLRHWLNYSEGMYPDFALSLEIAPSQDSDGSTLGQVTWFDYAGKPQGQNGEPGTQIQPSLIARKLPDGSTSYQSFTRNSFGLPTGVTTTYGTDNPALTRTYTLAYDP
ncbi:MAG TPA: hypothetical protein VJA21_05060, partial [Verrucomicrobiae bacterium]